MSSFKLMLLSFIVISLLPSEALSEGQEMRLGFIGSLTSFAGNYGTATLEGAQLAAKELNEEGVKISITVEDDQSVAKNTVTAFMKLTQVNKVQGIIGGSWWINAIVKKAERENLPVISCETLYNQDTILGSSYFIMQGDLREWIQVYEPLVARRGFKRGVIVRYVSGFGATLADGMKDLFSRSERSFVGEIEYNDIQLSEASSIVLQLKRMRADVIYVDAQPSGLANLLKKLADNGMSNITIFTNSIAEDILRNNLVDTSRFKEIYYTRRTTFDRDFAERFERYYGKQPYLSADLGYYSVYLLHTALKTSDSVSALKSGISVREKRFAFDNKNLFSGTPQEIWRIENGQGVKVLLK